MSCWAPGRNLKPSSQCFTDSFLVLSHGESKRVSQISQNGLWGQIIELYETGKGHKKYQTNSNLVMESCGYRMETEILFFPLVCMSVRCPVQSNDYNTYSRTRYVIVDPEGNKIVKLRESIYKGIWYRYRGGRMLK